MSHPQVVVLGIDGMDFDYTAAMLSELPNIQRLSRQGVFSPFKSVFPPDFIPSWITCYTGKDPSEHVFLNL
jgi:predicted AlkP superfamily phosphohydrolase/phosphomutase